MHIGQDMIGKGHPYGAGHDGHIIVDRDAYKRIMIISRPDVLMKCLKANLQGKIGLLD